MALWRPLGLVLGDLMYKQVLVLNNFFICFILLFLIVTRARTLTLTHSLTLTVLPRSIKAYWNKQTMNIKQSYKFSQHFEAVCSEDIEVKLIVKLFKLVKKPCLKLAIGLFL